MKPDYNLGLARGQIKLVFSPDTPPRKETWFDKFLGWFGLQRKVK
ncbi:gp12 [Mycobacterium phage Barnyard]|uniref:Uncharacterized protein n=1 Tax=Mycobacterium phage Barnyard TaxID=205880 RepID=Q856G0_9CAUD|nr:gp12 [Mycobacterium phage Barnyard]AAN02066.1 hypothetical protein PBI_BARNYARD_12 [Mycobacterium phage Barnyard]